jgi:hypothetical protein
MAHTPAVSLASSVLERPVLDAGTLRAQLMAPQPMQRVYALHELELSPPPGATAAQVVLADTAAQFAARGIPYYAVDDPDYCAWVDKAVAWWERLHMASVRAAAPRMRRLRAAHAADVRHA